MPLSTGARLGPYEILSAIGAGGMGEVYKARDTRLGRDVAIKVLPAGLNADPERRHRFELEARAVSALNHPHICVLHDVGSQDGIDFLVMEYLDGQSLAQRLRKGALPRAQVLELGAQIADALASAHRRGIVHRDLKPANIMLTKSGVKLLDFGLAKLRPQPSAADAGASALATKSVATRPGVVMGTVPYMAPEQLEGKDSDARTDLFAFGCVLYEMLTARRAFGGDTEASVISAIMTGEPPPLSTLQPLTPPALDRLVRRCLAKDPDDRWQHAADVAEELRGISQDAVATDGVRALTGVRPWRWRGTRLAWVAALVALLLAVVSTTMAAVLWRRSSATLLPREPVRFSLSDQLPAAGDSDPQRLFAVSRDGRRVVFVAERDGVPSLFLRDLHAVQATVVPGTEHAVEPFFSPDGQRIGFFAGGDLKVVALAGGTPVVLAQVAWPRGATWTPDDTIVFAPSADSGLWQVPAAGGAVRVVAQPDPARGERSYRWPEVFPGGDAVVFTIATSDIQSFDSARLVVRSLRTGEQRELIRGGSFATCTATGRLLFARAGALMAVPLDVARRTVAGAARTVLDGLVTYPINGAAQYAAGGDGTLVYVAGQAVARQAALSWVDSTGKTKMLATPPAAYQAVSIAPDERSAALDIDGANANIYLLDFERASMTRLTFEWSNNNPFWTPDGTRVGFTSARGGVGRLFWQATEGGALAEPLTPARPSSASIGSWTPDGRVLIFSELAQGTGWDIWTQAMDGERNPRPFLQTPFNETNPRFSPDGHWVAYDSDETGRTEVYALPFPGPGRKWRVSTDGGTQPVWARDGHELFYRNGDAMMAATINASPSFSSARPRLLFRKALRVAPQYQYDVAPDGRFLMIEPLPPQTRGPLTVVLNWYTELERRLSAAR